MAHPCSTPTLLCLVAALTLGCPGDDSSAEAGTSNADDSTSDPSTGGSTAGTMSGSATSVGTAEDSGSDTTGPGGPPCGDTTCSASEYCDWSLDACGGQPSDQGTCMPRPEGCDAVYQPVCGCDGLVHGNLCEAQSAGVDVDAQGECDAPEDYFRCGYRFCSVGFEYCQVSVSDVGGIADGYSCMSSAEPCEPLACACLSNEPCFEFSCEEAVDGGVAIVCPGG